MPKNTIWITATILLLAMVSCKKHDVKLATENHPTVKAKISKVGGSATEDYVIVSGKIRSENYANISSRMMGYITNVNAKVGDKVYANQILATISDADFQAKIAQADAGINAATTGLNNVEKDYNRILSLFEKESATQKEVDDITTQLNLMKTKLNQAQEAKNEVNTMLSYTKIKAPFNGIITEKFVNSGDLANPGMPLYSIESGDNFQVEAMVPESYIASINKGDEVIVVLKSNGETLKGKIQEYSSSAMNTGGQFMVKIALDKKDLKDIKLFSGMFVNVQLQNKNTSTSTEKILVNKSAIVQQGQLTGLFTLSDNQTAVLRWVRLGNTYGDQVEILSGLSLGESYITESESRIMNGSKIELN